MAEKFNEHEKNTTSSSICADLEAGASDAKFAAENLALEDGSNKNIAENSEVQGKQSAALTDVDIGMRQDRDKDLNLPVSLTQAIKEDENRGKPLAFDIQTSDDTLNDKQEEERWEGKESFALTDVDIGMIQHSDKDLNSPVSVAEAIQKDENSANPSSYSVPIESSHPSRQPPNVKKSGKTSDDNLNEKSEKERWQDAAIHLNEGLDNDNFDNHPKDRTTIKWYNIGHITWYNIAHSTWYNILDLMASTLLLSLALTEKTKVDTVPTEDVLILPVPVHGGLEILPLTIFAFGVFIKIMWQGVKSFFKHKRSFLKFIVLCIMCIEAIVVLVRSENHIRITRALRPLFLIDSNYLRGTRRVLRQIVLSLPPILYMLLVLLFFIFIYSILGFYLFSSNTKDVYFATFGTSFVSMFVLLTTANYPDVMMPSYAMSRWSVIFFVTYILIAIYFLMNLLLAVVYEAFTSMEKENFKVLFLHKREAAIHAYKLLHNEDAPQWIALPQFLGLMKFFKPKHDVLQNYLVYKSLEKDVKGGLNLEEFYEVFEKRKLVWRKVSDDKWFDCLAHKRGCCGLYDALKGIHGLVTSKPFEIFIYVAIVANGCSFVYEIVMLSKVPAKERKFDVLHSHWYNILFISIYGTEVLLKLLGLGIRRYFHSGWNWFDFIVTVLGIAGLIGAAANSFSFAFIVCLRPLRLLRLFKPRCHCISRRKKAERCPRCISLLKERCQRWISLLKERCQRWISRRKKAERCQRCISLLIERCQRWISLFEQSYRDVLDTMWVLTPRMFRVILVIMCIYYSFGIIGMECFAGLELKNCCVNISVGPSFEEDGYYYLNNFDDLLHAVVTLFELTVVNNWFIIMEGIVHSTSWSSRMYFMMFFIIIMVVMTIVVAFILEAFLFKIQYRKEHPKEETDMSIRTEVEVSYEELMELDSKFYVGLEPGKPVKKVSFFYFFISVSNTSSFKFMFKNS